MEAVVWPSIDIYNEIIKKGAITASSRTFWHNWNVSTESNEREGRVTSDKQEGQATIIR